MARVQVSTSAIYNLTGNIRVASDGTVAIIPTAGASYSFYIVSGGSASLEWTDTYETIFGYADTFGSMRVNFAIDSNDDLHFIFNRLVTAGAGGLATRDVVYMKATFNSGTSDWTKGSYTEIFGYSDGEPWQTTGTVGFRPAIEIDANDYVHIVFSDWVVSKGSGGTELHYTENTGGSWSTPISLGNRASKTDEFDYPEMLVIDANNIEVIYRYMTNQNGYDICYIRKVSGSWGSETRNTATNITSVAFRGICIYGSSSVQRLYRQTNLQLIDENNNVIISNTNGNVYWCSVYYYNGTRYVLNTIYNSSQSNYELHIIENSGSGWSSNALIDDTSGYYSTDVIAYFQYHHLNDAGVIHYIYEDSTNGYTYYDTYSLLSGTDTSDNQIAFAHGGIETSDNQIAYLAGSATTGMTWPVYLAGGIETNDNQIAYLVGSIDDLDNQIAWMAGGLEVSDNQAAYLDCHETATDNQIAYLSGSEEITDNQIAYLAGSQNTTSSQSAWIAGGTKIEVFVEDFNDNSLDTGVWTADTSNAGPMTWAETNERLEIYIPTKDNSNYGIEFYTDYLYTLLNSQIICRSWHPGDYGAGGELLLQNTDTYPHLHANVDDGLFYMGYRDDVGGWHQLYEVPENNTLYTWWRIRHDLATDTVYWDTSSDGISWTNRASETRANLETDGVDITYLRINVHGYTWNTTPSPQTMWFDNINNHDDSDNQIAYLAGIAGSSDNQLAYTHGQEETNGQQSGYTRGSQDSSAGLSVYLTAWASTQASTLGYLAGQNTASEAQAAYLRGWEHTSSDLPSYTAGSESLADQQSAFLHGQAIIPVQIPSRMDDDFNRASLGSNWTVGEGTVQITDNTLTASVAEAKLWWNVENPTNDQWVESTQLGSSWWGITARGSGSGENITAYIVWLPTVGDAVGMRIGWHNGGTGWGEYLDGSSWAVDFNHGDKLQLTVRGQSPNIVLAVYINGVLQRALHQDDFTNQSAIIDGGGRVGIYFNLTPNVFDDFRGGDLPKWYQYAYLVGGIETNDNQPAWLEGSAIAASDNQAAYLSGLDYGFDNIESYLSGRDNAFDNFVAYLSGSQDTQDSTQSYTKGSTNVSDTLESYLVGSSDINDNQIAYLEGQAGQAYDNQSAYLKGQDNATDNQEAYSRGQSQANAQLTGYTSGQQHTSDNVSCYVRAFDQVATSVPGYLSGQADQADTLSGYLDGQDTGSDNQLAYLNGSQSLSNSQWGYLLGSMDLATSQLGYINGQDLSSSAVSGFIAGSSPSTGETPAYLEGSQNTTDSISAYSEADAYEWLLPDNDIVVGGWENELGGTPLWSSIDDYPNTDDDDYVLYDGVTGSETFSISLSNPFGDPLTDPDGLFIIEWRPRQTQGTSTITVKVELWEAAVLIASDEQTISDTWQTFEYQLTPAEKASITAPQNLRLRVTITGVV